MLVRILIANRGEIAVRIPCMQGNGNKNSGSLF